MRRKKRPAVHTETFSRYRVYEARRRPLEVLARVGFYTRSIGGSEHIELFKNVAALACAQNVPTDQWCERKLV